MIDRPDLVPAEMRAAWVDAGFTPGVDLRTLFDEQVKRHPDKVAVIDDQKSTTYAELSDMADRIAGLLQRWGIESGEIVALQLPNAAEACAADLAVATVGAICLPYPVLYRHNEVRSLLARSGAVACLCAKRLRDFDYEEMLLDLAPDLPSLRHIGVLGAAAPGPVTQSTAGLAAAAGGQTATGGSSRPIGAQSATGCTSSAASGPGARQVGGSSSETRGGQADASGPGAGGSADELAGVRGGSARGVRVDSIDDVLAAPGAAPAGPAVVVGAHDPARILVTSGTEAAPKMVLYSHAAIGGGIGNIFGALRPDEDTRFLLLPPLSTGFGSLGTFAGVARFGVTLVVTSAFDPAGVIKLIERERVTHVLAVPTMLAMMLATGAGDADLSSLEVVGSFGAAMSEDRVRATLQTFGCRFVNGYGCSDGAVSLTGWDDPPEKIASTVGRPAPSTTEVRILGGDGAEVAEGETGEVCARGPMSPLGYLNSPELDEQYRFDGGWVRTGDLGFLDGEGYLHITGRKKDIIVRGGYNISPAETEAALCRHPAVTEAACVGYPDERLGERMAAFVVLAPGAEAPTLEELDAFLVADGLARIKVPERLEVIDALPLNPTGKILKRVLRERFEPTAAQS